MALVFEGNDITISAAQNNEHNESYSQTKKSGLSFSLSSGIGYSKARAISSGTGEATSATASLLSANQGNLTLIAGTDEQYKGTGSGNITTEGADLLAKQKVILSGNAVKLLESDAIQHSRTDSKSKSFTVGSQLAGTVGKQITDIYNMAQTAAEGTGNSRLDGAYALKAGYDAYKLIGAMSQGSAPVNSGTGGGDSAFGISVSANYSKSESHSTDDSRRIQGTNIQANQISVTAREGDLTAVAAKLQAEEIDLSAAKNLNLQAGINSADTHSRNKGSSVGGGVTFGLGQQTGVSFQIGASANKDRADGSETNYDNTLITATKRLRTHSGGDTTLDGAQLAGKTVQMDVGGNLNVTTRQDDSHYDSKQQSGGFNLSICVPPICVGQTVSGSVNYAQTKINHNYQSATGQSGIAAGEGGFDIKVKGNTALNGGALTSSADKDKNHLTTGTLSYTDLTNRQTMKSSSVSISAGTEANAYLQLAQNALANLAGNSGLPKNQNETSQTHAVISPANISLTAGDAQSQANAAELTGRDAVTANQALTNTLKLQDVAQMEQAMKMAQDNAKAANLVGAVMSNVIGDVAQSFHAQAQLAENARALAAGEKPKEVSTWADGSVEKVLLHALAGAIQAKIAGGDLAVGMVSGALNEKLVPIMADFLHEQGVQEFVQDTDGKFVKNSNFGGLMQLGSTLAGAALGAVAGDISSASLAANVANNVTEHNRLLHQSEYDKTKQLSKNKATLEALSKLEGHTITEQELEGRILAEMMKNSDSLIASENSTHDYHLRQLVGCNILNCSGLKGQVDGYYNNTQNLDAARRNWGATSAVKN